MLTSNAPRLIASKVTLERFWLTCTFEWLPLYFLNKIIDPLQCIRIIDLLI